MNSHRSIAAVIVISLGTLAHCSDDDSNENYLSIDAAIDGDFSTDEGGSNSGGTAGRGGMGGSGGKAGSGGTAGSGGSLLEGGASDASDAAADGMPPDGSPEADASGSMDGAAASLSDSQIAQVTTEVNLGEVLQGQVARLRAGSETVRQFADRMVSEHTAAIAEQQQVLDGLNISASASELSEQVRLEGLAVLNELFEAEPGSFDLTYINTQVQLHGEALTLLDMRLIPAADTDEMRALLTTLRMSVMQHHTRAQEIRTELTGGADGGS